MGNYACTPCECGGLCETCNPQVFVVTLVGRIKVEHRELLATNYDEARQIAEELWPRKIIADIRLR